MKTFFSVLAVSMVLLANSVAIEPVNDKCPVCGKNVRLIFHSNYKEKRIAFATADCKGDFDKNPEKYSVKPK